jgi:NAD(P)-dependent dehydrogenase (short-subunit alcohol dehydrogenase family)
MKRFKGKVAVIVGASGSIGRALAQRCAQEGMKVVIADMDKKALAKTQRDLEAEGASVLAVKVDVTKPEEMEALAKKTVDKFGAVHLLCNTWGVYTLTSIAESTLADWQWVIGVNLWSVIYSMRAFIPIMLEQDTECHIVNTTPVLGGLYALPYNGPYNVSKYGIVTLSETVSIELAAKKAKLKLSIFAPDYDETGIQDSEQHRPAEFKNAAAKAKRGKGDPNFEKIKELIEATRKAGAPPEQLADIVFDAIKEEKFYIFANPTSHILTHDRMERAVQQRNPENILKMMGVVS